MIATFAAHAFTVLLLKRSILTEKISRRGLHLSREYAVDPLETMFVKDVMQPATLESVDQSVAAYPDESLREVVYRMAASGLTSMPVSDPDTGGTLGTVSLEDLLQARSRNLHEESIRERVLGLR
jgi:CBS-domain-containing membrane protein